MTLAPHGFATVKSYVPCLPFFAFTVTERELVEFQTTVGLSNPPVGEMVTLAPFCRLEPMIVNVPVCPFVIIAGALDVGDVTLGAVHAVVVVVEEVVVGGVVVEDEVVVVTGSPTIVINDDRVIFDEPNLGPMKEYDFRGETTVTFMRSLPKDA